MAPTPWAQVRLPILLDRPPRRRARLPPYKTGRPANGHGHDKPKNARPAPPGLSAAGEERSLSQPRLCLLPGSRPLAAPSPVPSPPAPSAPGPPCCGRAAGRAVPAGAGAGAGAAWTAEMTRRWESWAACPGPGHPLAQFRSRPRESRLLPGPWEAGDPPPACAQPGAPASYPLSRASPCGWGSSRGRDGVRISGPRLLQILQQFPRRGSPPRFLRASASPRGRRPRSAADSASLVTLPAWRWVSGCPNLT